MRITFHGATRQVTGSAHLLEIGPHRILLDCGLFDGNRFDPDGPNRRFDFDPRSLDAVIVSHAHNDHIGRLPCLVRRGYAGPVYATPATADILGVMLRDSARIQREDARNPNFQHRGRSSNPRNSAPDLAPVRAASPAAAVDNAPREPLFELIDVEMLVDAVRRVPCAKPLEILDGVTLTYHDSGHILGAAMIQLDFRENGRRRRLLFTGDIGRRDTHLLPDPTIVKDIDILISESTYGHKTLDSHDTLLKQLHAIVLRAIRLKSRVVIPAFSLGRTQRMIYCFQELFGVHKVKPVPVYVDSPLAIRLTDVHRDHPYAYTRRARAVMERDEGYFRSEHIEFCMTFEESRRVNHRPGPLVVIASSGMCEAGRVRHHLRHAVQNPDNAVVIVSYQAENTLGRQIAEGAERVTIMDQPHELNAAVYVLDGFSGHADRDDLAWWYENTGGGIEHAFLVHGEPEAMQALVPVLQPHVKNPVHIPELAQTYEI